ncbi:MAG: glycoside hydrolase family 1 protein [Pelagibacteraceae bacterium TMED124]|nr:beta-glucosidase [Candidatus Neomarinimicrobiota bacterium]RPG17348.1 MAG: glycoside hydrolase family 1 protein [Pelagibacteraceae bacterium TMED124]
MIISLIILLLVLYFATIIYMNYSYPELKWDWTNIDTNKISLPNKFIWGTATASHQVEGSCNNNNWYKWENSRDQNGKPAIKSNQKAGIACDHWNNYKNDILLLEKLGVSHYRFSLEWSKIEPEKGKFSSSAIKHYSNVIDSLMEKNITPVITLHHFTNPIWFDDLGGFEKEKNIEHFVSFSKHVFKKYSNKVKKWCTINEPEVYSVMGYFAGVFPPGKKSPQLTIEVLKNLLIAHTNVYAAIKSLPNGKDCDIGIVKNIMQFDPYRRWHLLDWIVCRITDKIYNDISLSYLKYGKIKVNYPFFIKMNYRSPNTPYTDFLGLNYYSHSHLKFKFDKYEFFENKFFKKDITTDMPYVIYPEGLYRAIYTVKDMGMPIIITENGIADSKDDRRELFIERYIYAMSKAIKDGADVKGYFYWSLMDNFEWAEGYDMRFGLYEVDFKTQKRTLRKGAHKFVNIVNEFN